MSKMNCYVSIASLSKKDKSKANYIRCLQNRGYIKKYLDSNGHLCYSVRELQDYKKNVKIGRPLKNAVVITSQGENE